MFVKVPLPAVEVSKNSVSPPNPPPFAPPLLVKVPFSWALAEERARKDSRRAAPNRRFRVARQKSDRRADIRGNTVGVCVVLIVSFSVEFFGRCIFSFQICPGGIGWLRPHSNISLPISSIPPRAAFRTSGGRLFVFTSYINAASELLQGKWRRRSLWRDLRLMGDE